MARKDSLLLAACAWWLLGAATGLDRPFPPMPGEKPTAARVELGRLLFFDPLLSRDGALSCAHCHRPERFLADGLRRARVRGGMELARNTPTLYNAAFKQRPMWDRRADSLDAQALIPLLSPAELGANPARVIARLSALPEYPAHFARAFPQDSQPLSLRNPARALAAFQRTLVSQNSRYDRWTRGARDALSPEELRGLALFRSLNTRCFECHRPPTFGAPLALGVGVASPDPGVAGAGGTAAQHGFFGVPSLRNAAGTAPYMHDGSLATLEDVIEFYRLGGGRALGIPAARISGQIRAFDISDAEAAALAAFLRSLSDESARPRVPNRVPSGLPILDALPQTVEDFP